MTQFVVAVKREKRAEGVTVDGALAMDGVTMQGAYRPHQAVIEASEETAKAIAERFSDRLNVEAVQSYSPQK